MNLCFFGLLFKYVCFNLEKKNIYKCGCLLILLVCCDCVVSLFVDLGGFIFIFEMNNLDIECFEFNSVLWLWND